jgi:hypothetical protein
VDIRFVDIGGIVDNHCLSFHFVNYYFLKNGRCLSVTYVNILLPCIYRLINCSRYQHNSNSTHVTLINNQLSNIDISHDVVLFNSNTTGATS